MKVSKWQVIGSQHPKHHPINTNYSICRCTKRRRKSSS